MKTNLTRTIGFALLSTAFSACHSDNGTDRKGAVTQINKDTTSTQTIQKPNITEDSILLTHLVKQLYKWHITQKRQYDGFKAIKLDPTDTLNKAIDLDENQKAINELQTTGLFADDFLKNYRCIAVRMDKELREGSSLWPDGKMPTFDNDVDAWCNCQDSPIDNYWAIIKLKDISINNNVAQFKWTWGDDFTYEMQAVNENGNWKISYMQGFDMKTYNWEWVKNHKSK